MSRRDTAVDKPPNFPVNVDGQQRGGVAAWHRRAGRAGDHESCGDEAGKPASEEVVATPEETG